MNITKDQMEEMLESAKPLMKWISDNCHPHCKAIVDDCRVELVEGIATNLTTEFVKD